MTDKLQQEETNTGNPETHLSRSAKKALECFQRGRELYFKGKVHDSEPYLQEFHQTLVMFLQGYEHGESDYTLREVCLTGTNIHNYLSLRSGTSGQRIYFLNHKPGDVDAPMGGPIRWMAYIKPEGEIGKELYDSFVAHFGTDSVDLLQKLE